MQNRGVASADQAINVQVSANISKEKQGKTKKRLTESNDVAESTKGSEMELAFLDLLAAGDERDKDGSRVTQRQANDTDTGEGVESSSGTKVDETKDELDCHAEHHGVEWHVELRVDRLPQLVTGNGAVTGKGPGSAGCGCRAANTAKQTKDEQRDE